MSSYARIPGFGADVEIRIVRRRRRAGFVIDIGEPFVDVAIVERDSEGGEKLGGAVVTILSRYDGVITRYFLREGDLTKAGEPFAELYTASGAIIVPKIFLSYRQADTGAMAGRLFERLRDRFGRWQIFFDVDALEPGRNYRLRMDSALEQTSVMVILIGKHWLTGEDGVSRLKSRGDLHRREIRTALRRGIPVLPVLVEYAKMPARSALPRDLVSLSDQQALRVSHTQWESDTEQILKTLDALIR